MSKSCSCCKDTDETRRAGDAAGNAEAYICYCSKVKEEDIRAAILDKGARTVEQVIAMTGAMSESNCAVNNPKGICCYPDIVAAFEKYVDRRHALMQLNV